MREEKERLKNDDKEKKNPLTNNERLVILLIIAHIVLFVSMALVWYILSIINGILYEINEFGRNLRELVSIFGGSNGD